VRSLSHAGKAAVNLQAAASALVWEIAGAPGEATCKQCQAVPAMVSARRFPVVSGDSYAAILELVDDWVSQMCHDMIVESHHWMAGPRDCSGCPDVIDSVAQDRDAGAVKNSITGVVGLAGDCYHMITFVIALE
jgi:hypothetical protein